MCTRLSSSKMTGCHTLKVTKVGYTTHALWKTDQNWSHYWILSLYGFSIRFRLAIQSGLCILIESYVYLDYIYDTCIEFFFPPSNYMRWIQYKIKDLIIFYYFENRYGQVVYTRCRICHSRLTHSYLLKGEKEKVFDLSNNFLSVKIY